MLSGKAPDRRDEKALPVIYIAGQRFLIVLNEITY